MYEIIYYEFIKWANNYREQNDLSPSEANVLRIILENFDEVASKGTAAGARANYLSSKMEEEKFLLSQCSLDLKQNAISESSSLEHLQKLEVQSFRGFSTNLVFDFSKQYTTFFGLNGSGKSSLCDALEYCILGTVQEATTRRIGLDEFLKNKKTNLFIPPKLYARVGGEEVLFKCNYEKYQFSFIEKNRIDKFSHINASTPGDKADRLAALFGLTEFSDFVKNFSDSLAGKISISSECAQIKEEREKKYEEYSNQIKDLTGKISNCDIDCKKIITSIGEECPQELDAAIKYLQSDDGSGRIRDLEDAALKEKKPEFDTSRFDFIIQLILIVRKQYDELKFIESQLLSFCVNSDLVGIFSSVINLSSDIDHTVCPVCQTPVERAEKNPFDYAKEELDKLGAYNNLRESLREKQTNLLKETKRLNDELLKNKEMIETIGLSLSALLFTIPEDIDYYLDKNSKDSFEDVLSRLLVISSNKDDYVSAIIKHNDIAKENNNNNYYSKEAKRLRDKLHALIEICGKKKALLDERTIKTAEIERINSERKEINEKVTEEKEMNQRKTEYIDAYSRLISDLKKYQLQLPLLMASNLSDMVKTYYNTMNRGDASFELIDTLSMPVSPEENMMIRFKDNIEVNALQVLSEGHVKLLGLAILLAKAKETKQRFIILDDIVNAIDDDHRSGVASLLFHNGDFDDIQIILTCHSESFIKRIEDCINIKHRTDIISRYVFMSPVEDISSRGIVVNYANPREPLELARKDLEKNEFKDALEKCRQATESLISKLWKNLSSQYNIQLLVALRDPKSRPELYSVVNGIISFLSKYKDDANEILCILNDLKSSYNWFLLNKSAHYEDDQFQFEATDVRNIFGLLERLDSAIKTLKIRSLIIVE